MSTAIRVEDVTTHPAFRNAARSIARLYDALHDPKTKDILTWSTDTGSGGFTHKFFRAARSRDELIAPARRHRAMGAAVLWLDGAFARLQSLADEHARGQSSVLRKFSGNAKAWYRRAQEHVLFMNHAIVNPPVDRAKGGRPGEGRVHHHPEGDRRRHLCLRRQGGRDLVCAHPLQLSRPERRGGADATTPI